MKKTRLRTKFLISLLAVTAGLSTATLSIVSYRVKKQAREELRDDLRSSLRTYAIFEQQRNDMLSHSAALVANLPILRALMSTEHAATIQDASGDLWRLSGSDLLALAGRRGNVLAVQSGAHKFDQASAQKLFEQSLTRGQGRDWWFDGTHLFEVWIQPVYFGEEAQQSTVGYLAVGHAVDENAARELGDVASSEAVFRYGSQIAAATFPPEQQSDLAHQLQTLPAEPAEEAQEVHLGKEQFLLTTVPLSAPSSSDAQSAVSLTVLKSLDKATDFLRQINHVLVALGLLCVVLGSALVFLISDTFTRPLARLVSGVRALEMGDFSYPLEVRTGDEVAEVSVAFDRMRSSLQKTQEEQKQLENRLRQAHKMEAVGRLAGGVAHDFNNLLTVIRGHTDLLLERVKVDDSTQRSVEQIRKAADKAVSMTRQLLAFSRMQVLQPRILDLNAAVGEMGKMLSRLIGEHIEYNFVPGAGLSYVKADPGQIEQVILNLVVNARDAMPSGGTVTVRTLDVVLDEAEAAKRPPMHPGNYVLLSVSDTGQGMTEDVKAHIFEPFFTTKEVGKGTGLGLATVYGVVKQSEGFIFVETAPGKGATFEVYLPQASGKPSDTDIAPAPVAAPRGAGTILVAEDESGVRELICDFLQKAGYSVLQASNGVEAFDIARRHSGAIDLVLSDMVMPKMSGAELAQRIQGARPKTKILLMSGYSELLASTGGNSGVQYPILQKPFSLMALAEKVRGALAGGAEQPNQVPIASS